MPRPSSRRARTSVLLAAIGAAVVLAGCADTSGATEVAVESSDDACTPETTELDAGKITFVVENTGGDVTELYVYDGDRVMSEVENIGPGTTRELTVDLPAGEYELVCKPGMEGDGISTTVSVTGEGGTAAAEPDRTVGVA